MNRPDFSDFVAHFTKDSSPPVEQGGSAGDLPQSISGSAYDRLVSILQSKRIIATTMPWTNRKAVAFTECPFWSLIDHAQRYSSYGLGFTKAHLFAAGGGPAIYLRPDLYKKQGNYVHEGRPDWRGFHPDLYAFVTPFVPAYAPDWVKQEWDRPLADYTHEREWRVPHDFTFDQSEVQFVIVKSYEDMARLPKELKDGIGRDNFVIMDMYRQIESLWPTHRVD